MLKEYLFGTLNSTNSLPKSDIKENIPKNGYKLLVMSEKNIIQKDSFLLINNTPAMPKVNVKVVSDDSKFKGKEVEFRIKIEYFRDCQCEG